MSLRRRTTELSQRMQTHLYQAQGIENTTLEDHVDDFRAARLIRPHRRKLGHTKEKVDTLGTQLRQRENSVSARITRLEQTVQKNRENNELQTQVMLAMQEQLNETRNELALTKSKQIELMKMKTDLHIGQTTYNFERDLASYIYPRGAAPTYDRQIFTNLMTWLWVNRKTQAGREANKKWTALKTQFGWSYKHRKVFFDMLECRRKAAHPQPPNLGLSIPERFNVDERRLIEVIRRMGTKLKKLLRHHRSAVAF